ncbi:MAG: pyruvate formate lyase family protein, partial [Coprothermobacterota bacterium]|nr:pyruvate formate lyase family protein [Coprothermobacterota bacterium]
MINERVQMLRQASLEIRPWISSERAQIVTDVYREAGFVSAPLLRAMVFSALMERKAISIGAGELIVGERGPAPKGTPTFPELCCHTLSDLEILDSREKISYIVSDEVHTTYAESVIPFWQGKTMRERLFGEMTPEWVAAYKAGIFTEFMEQRAPGHTVADGKIYRKGFLQFQAEIKEQLQALDYTHDPHAYERSQQLRAMAMDCQAIIGYAQRYAKLASRLAEAEADPKRKKELAKIAEVCSWVPAHAPRDFWEALQMYWFVHLGVVTELNTWDSFCPGHLDRHLQPFYQAGLAQETLTREQAKELLQCFWVKFNNQPAPPKVGGTAADSGTYTDFANNNIGGLLADGKDGVSDTSHLIVEVIDEMRL